MKKIKLKMPSSTSIPQQSLPERSKTKMAELDQKFETDLDKFRTALFKEYETHVSSLRASFKESQQSAIDVEHALKLSDTRNRVFDLKLQEEKQRVVNLTSELSTQKQDAKDKHNEVTVKLASTKDDLQKAKSTLEEANRRAAGLQQDLGAASQRISALQRDYATVEHRDRERLEALNAVTEHKVHLEAELELTKRQPADLHKRLKAAEQQNVDLKADLQAATQRASTAEDELKTFKSRFKQINDEMTALASSSGQPPIVVQPAASALAPSEQGSVEGSRSGPQNNDSPGQTQSRDSRVGNSTSDNDSDLLHCQSILDEVMDMKNWQHNQYFLKAMDSLTLASLDAKMGPMNLGTMKEKLAGGVYTLATSFKADFGLMIADCRRLNPSQSPLRIAAEQLLRIFEQAFSAQPLSDHQSAGSARPIQGTRNKKRKAATDISVSSDDGQVQKRRSVAPLEQDTNHVQPVNPGPGGSLTSALSSSDQSKDNSQGPNKIDVDHVEGKITTGKRLGIDATLSAVAQLVSTIKSPSTITGHWKSLIPDNYWLTNHAKPPEVEDRIWDLVHDPSEDVIILRIMPAAESDSPEFDRVFEYLLQKERFATVSHAGVDDVEDIYLIPASRAAGYPKFFSTLDFDLLPPTKTENVLFMAIVFCVAEDKQRQVRDAWDRRMEAIQNHDDGALTSMRNILVRNPLHICRYQPAILSSAEHHMLRLRDLPYSDDIASPELKVYGQDILRLSYPKWPEVSRPSLDGFVAPEWVFVLGRVVSPKVYHGILVTDIQQRDRPLWLIRCLFETRTPWKRNITLLRSRFPGSLNEWEKLFPDRIPPTPSMRCLLQTGVKAERCKLAE